MRGWVYIITTKSMPDLLKIGFTLKDPDLRALELGRTGLPHPYVVEFEVLVLHPKAIEKKAHASLKGKREAKEWFRCSVQEAVFVIRKIVGDGAILEKVRGSLAADAPLELASGLGSEKQVTTKGLRSTGAYSGVCTHCGKRFAVNLTRQNSPARCPNCFRMSGTSEFERREFII